MLPIPASRISAPQREVTEPGKRARTSSMHPQVTVELDSADGTHGALPFAPAQAHAGAALSPRDRQAIDSLLGMGMLTGSSRTQQRTRRANGRAGRTRAAWLMMRTR